MREILFKAKRIDNGEWIEGNHVYLENAHYIVPLYIEWNETEQRESPMFIRVDRKTLCQYTGFEDENKKRIWENDIVKHEQSETIGTVKWYQEDYAGWCVDDVVIDEQQFTDEMWSECEVIGNCFDNPELLGQDGG